MPQPLGEKFCGSAPMPASLKVFLSTVSDEFRAYRDQLRADLTRHNVEVKVQEDFKDLGGDTLDKLDVYISHCDCVVHLIGDMTGSAPLKRDVDALLAKYPDLVADLLDVGLLEDVAVQEPDAGDVVVLGHEQAGSLDIHRVVSKGWCRGSI